MKIAIIFVIVLIVYVIWRYFMMERKVGMDVNQFIDLLYKDEEK